MLKTNPGELENRLEQQMNEMKDLRHAAGEVQGPGVSGRGTDRSCLGAKTVGELKVHHRSAGTAWTPTAMRKMGDFLRDKEPSVVARAGQLSTARRSRFLAVCGKEAVAKGVKAGDIIKAVAAICGGKGGGKPDSAMGGGTDVLKLDDALATVDDFVAGKLVENRERRVCLTCRP